ncbi:hypothetical protein [Pantoea septica]|uniref:hypothetical protein n=1 Tax=Pantoea septica TaxID=472695 RepID=UPI0023F2386C|nr:hypothetical protein [Pantoea septica]
MRWLIMIALVISGSALADSQCGPFKLGTSDANDGWARINGARPESQKFTFLKANGDYENVKMQWMVQRADAPGWFGMDYVKRNGKAILNVEVVRTNMDEPRQFWTYDCRRVK